MINILVCDDDKDIVDAIEIYLAPEGYRILKAYDGIQAIEMMRKNDIQLLIMDVMMPRMDGIRATLKIREEANIPIIILSAKTEDTDKIFGLNVGADDYVTKPFNSLELVARVKSQLRRYTKLGTMTQEPTSNVYKTGGLEINDDMKQVTVCLLYTSDAADEEDSVDLGGRRILKKKKRERTWRRRGLQKKIKQADT